MDEKKKGNGCGWIIFFALMLVGAFVVILSRTENKTLNIISLVILSSFFILLIYVGIHSAVENSKAEQRRAIETKQKQTANTIKLKEETVERKAWLEQNGYTVSKLIENKIAGDVVNSLIVDTERRVVIFDEKPVAFRDIIGAELITETAQTASSTGGKTGGVGRAVVGGVLAGGAGAVVGAVTAKEQSTTRMTGTENAIGVRIYTSDIESPNINYEARYNQSFCREVYATMLAVIEQGKRE